MRESIFVLNGFFDVDLVLVDESEEFVAASVKKPGLAVIVCNRILW